MNTTRNENRDEKRVRCHSGFERRSLNFLQTSFFARRRTRDKEGTPDRQIEIWNSYPRRRWQISFSMARGKFVERSLTAYCERGKKRERERGREKNVSVRGTCSVRSSFRSRDRSHSCALGQTPLTFCSQLINSPPTAAFPRIFLLRA